MKYIKGYKLFEDFNSDMELLSKVKEAFYNISDKYDLSISLPGTFKHNPDRLSVSHGRQIGPEGASDYINFSDIKDDLEFAIDYLSSELNLEFDSLYVYGEPDISGIYVRYEDFLNDIDVYGVKIDEVKILDFSLYFKNTKKGA